MENGIVFLACLVVLFAGKVVYLSKIKIKYLKKRVSEEIFVYDSYKQRWSTQSHFSVICFIS